MVDVCNMAYVQEPDGVEYRVENEDEEERCAEHFVAWCAEGRLCSGRVTWYRIKGVI
jgi:hypothetical protein